MITWSGIFFSILIENISIPFPVEACYLLAADLIKRGYSYAWLLTLLTTAHLSGSMIAYGLGWWGKDYLMKRFHHRKRFLQVSNSIHNWYERYWNITVFATRFIGYVRPWSSLVAGFARINWLPFLFWTLLGSLIFNIIALEFTLYFLGWWHQFGTLLRYLAIGLFLLSFTAIYWLQHFWRRRP
ncbi:MAG: VTT domain-containing protein [Firmicutes bacterium]|nr:VTT domain-containing protein [Bacillota bacterium]